MGFAEALGTVVVGAGLMGRWHARAAERCGARLVAVVDTHRERARRLASRHRGSVPVDDLATALEMPGVHVVHLCTPLASHVELARQAVASGRHVLVEKPMAPSAAETEELLDGAVAAGVLLCPVHQFLFQRGVQRALALRAAIGTLRHIDTVACSAGAEGASAPERDEVTREILPHPLSLFGRLADIPVGDVEWNVLHPGPGELRACGELEGVTLTMLVSMSGRPTRNSVRLVGEAGTLHADLFHGFVVREGGTVSRTRKALRPFTHSAATLWRATTNLAVRAARREPAFPGLAELVRRFHAAVREDAPPPITVPEIMDVARARDRVIQKMMQAAGLPA